MGAPTGWLWIVRLRMAALCVLFSVAASAQAIPQPPAAPPSAADAATAKKNFDSGLKLYGEQAYAEALIAFEASYRLGGRPSALKNVAQCHRNLRHVVEAYEAYEQLLSLHEAQLAAPEKAAVRTALDELALLTVALTVTVNEAGAQIELDGKAVGASPLPKPKRVMVAEHRLRVTKAGFEPFEKTFETKAQKDEKIEVALEPERTSGHLVVREQAGREVRVLIDGEDKGAAPWEGDVAAGEHAIEVKGPRFASEKRTLKVARKERLDLTFDALALFGRLRVTTVPASASIAVDGKPLGNGVWDGELSPGPHTIEASLPGYPPLRREVTVQRGETIVQEIPLIAAIPGAHEQTYRGAYVRITAMPAFALNSPPDNSQPGQSTEEAKLHLGLAGDLRVGYALDPIAIELVASFMFEHRESQLSYDDPAFAGGGGNGQRTARFETNGPNFFLGVGPRITSRDEAVRFTFGIAPGIASRRFPTDRHFDGQACPTNPNPTGPGPTCQGNGDQSLGSPGYTTLGFRADGGMLLGSTPGTKFFLGAHLWLDFPPGGMLAGPDNTVPARALAGPGPGYKVVDSVQLFIGPVLGVQFGY